MHSPLLHRHAYRALPRKGGMQQLLLHAAALVIACNQTSAPCCLPPFTATSLLFTHINMRAVPAAPCSYSDCAGPDTGGSHLAQAPAMAGRLAEKVAGAAGIAAQAAAGAVSAMSQAMKAASGAAAGIEHAHGGAAHQQAEGRDASPVSDDATVDELEKGSSSSSGGVEWGQQVADTVADTAKAGEVDTASGTATDEGVRRKAEQGGYKQAANRLMDIEGLPRKDDSGINSGKA